MSPTLAPASAPQRTQTANAWLRPFVPRPFVRNAHLQTIFGNFSRRRGSLPQPAEPLIVPVEDAHVFRHRDGSLVDVPETAILCLCHWQPAAVRLQRPTVVLVHGLEGSANSGYILGNTLRLWQQGCNVVRMNMRSCGGTDALAPTIYHSGRAEDIAALVQALVLRGFAQVVLAGYSMGGNLVLRYAGQQALLPPAQREQALAAVIGVSPLLDLAPSSAALHLSSNRLYERRFLRAMQRRLRAKAQLFPAMYGMLADEGVYQRIHALRDFDHEIVARYGGFADAADYYEQVRSSRFASSIAVPTLILHAADDPFIRTLPATVAALRANPYVDYVQTTHGGHCAFLAGATQPAAESSAEPAAGDDQGRWAEETLARWLLSKLPA